MTINSDGTITLIDETQKEVTITDIRKNSDTSFTTYYDTEVQAGQFTVVAKIKFDINFSGDSSGTVTPTTTLTVSGNEQTQQGETTNIVKK